MTCKDSGRGKEKYSFALLVEAEERIARGTYARSNLLACRLSMRTATEHLAHGTAVRVTAIGISAIALPEMLEQNFTLSNDDTTALTTVLVPPNPGLVRQGAKRIPVELRVQFLMCIPKTNLYLSGREVSKRRTHSCLLWLRIADAILLA